MIPNFLCRLEVAAVELRLLFVIKGSVWRKSTFLPTTTILALHLKHTKLVKPFTQEGNCPPPIPKVAPAIFRLIKLLMCKPKKCVSTNQRNCLKKTILLQLLVETDQSSMVYQFPMINQTLCVV